MSGFAAWLKLGAVLAVLALAVAAGGVLLEFFGWDVARELMWKSGLAIVLLVLTGGVIGQLTRSRGGQEPHQ